MPSPASRNKKAFWFVLPTTSHCCEPTFVVYRTGLPDDDRQSARLRRTLVHASGLIQRVVAEANQERRPGDPALNALRQAADALECQLSLFAGNLTSSSVSSVQAAIILQRLDQQQNVHGRCEMDEIIAGDIGGRLRRARKQRGLSLQDAAGRTKLSIRVLQAIERNDFESLPGGIYRKGYLRSLAGEVGLDPTEIAAEYDKEFEPVTDPAAVANRNVLC